MKLLLATASVILLAAPASADIRQQYQQTQQQEQAQENFRAMAFQNAQFLRGEHPELWSPDDLKKRVYVHTDGEVYDVYLHKIVRIGSTKKITNGCPLRCQIERNVYSIDWQYFVEGDALVEYTTYYYEDGTTQTKRRVRALSMSRVPLEWRMITYK